MIKHNRIPNDLRVVNYKKKQEKDTKHIEIQGVKSDLKRRVTKGIGRKTINQPQDSNDECRSAEPVVSAFVWHDKA